MSSRKLLSILPVLVVLAVVATLFAPALFQGKILAPLDITTKLLSPWSETANGAKPHNQSPSDAVTQYLPYRIFAEKSLREDGYIGWNSYEMGGYSLAANTMALPASWPLQLHRWLPFKDAWNLGILGEFLIAGFGMLGFLRSRKIPWIPCLIGAVAFMLNTQFIIWIYHRWALSSFCWLPWVLWVFGDGTFSKPLCRKTILLAAFVTLAIMGGTLQHLIFVFLACACLAAGSFNFKKPFSNFPALLSWAIVFSLAMGMNAFTLVPQIQGYLSNIATGQIRGAIGYENGITQPFFHALLIPARIWPWLAGDPQSMDAFRLLKSGFMDLNYIGTIPMLLAFAGLFVRKMPRAAKWLIATGLIIPLTPLIGPLYHRVELLFILGAAWMTAEMLTHLARSRSQETTTPTASEPIINHQSSIQNHQSSPSSLTSRISLPWQRILITAVSAIGLTLILAAFIPSGLRGKLEQQVVSKVLSKSEDSQFGADQDWIASRAVEWTRRFSITHPRTAWVYGLLVLGSAGLILSYSINNQQSAINNRKSSPLLSRSTVGHLLIFCATTLELATLFHTWTTFSDPRDLRPSNPAIEAVRSLASPNRILQNYPDSKFTDVFAVPNLLSSYEIPTVDAYESIQYRSSMTALRKEPASTQLSLAGVGIAVSPTSATPPLGTESWETLPLSKTFVLRKNPSVPPAYTTGSSPLPKSPQAILDCLKLASPLTPTLQTSNRLAFDLPQNSKWIRISQNWHQGWKWRVPGQKWQPFRNGIDAACWIDHLPPSAHNLEVQFFPRPRWLTFTSLATLIASAGLFAILPRKQAQS